MTRIFKIGEEMNVGVEEEFDIRIDDAPQGISARIINEQLLDMSGSSVVRQEAGSTFFHFRAMALGIQKLEFPPTLLRQTVEIHNIVGVPNAESADESAGTLPVPGIESLPTLGMDFPLGGILPTA